MVKEEKEVIIVVCPHCGSENKHGLADGWRECNEFYFKDGIKTIFPRGCPGYFLLSGNIKSN